MTGGVNIRLYGCVILLALECDVCLFAYGCVISNQSTSKKAHVSDVSKLDALLHKTYSKVLSGIKVPRLDIYRSIILLSKIAHQMWYDHSFSQRNKTSKIAVEVKIGDNEKRGWTKIRKYGVGNIGGSSQQREC